MDEKLLHEVGQRFTRIVTVEDGVRIGGMGTAVLEFMADHGYAVRVKRIGIPDRFVEHGNVQELHKLCGLSEDEIVKQLE